MTIRKPPSAEDVLDAVRNLSGTIDRANSYLEMISDTMEKLRSDVCWLIDNREDVFGILKSDAPQEAVACHECDATIPITEGLNKGWIEISRIEGKLYGNCPSCVEAEENAVPIDPAISEPPLEQRIANHEQWEVEVRDPAQKSSEGVRWLRVPGAEANYEIGRTLREKWAVSLHASYTKGDCSGRGTPWKECETRDECVETFLEFARQHFGGKNIQDSQRAAQKAMLQLLKGDGLFPFLEPEPTKEKPQYLPA